THLLVCPATSRQSFILARLLFHRWRAQVSNPRRVLSAQAKEEFHVRQVCCPFVIGKTLEEDFAVPLRANAIIQQHQHAAVFERTDETSEPLLESDDCGRNLIVKEG